MSLIKCSECGGDVSEKAVSCPHCGNPINPQTPQQEEYLCCPKCGSRDLHAEHKGFSGGKALAGAIVSGGIGLLAGTIGSKDTQITCLKCGNKFKAGEARVVNSSETEYDIENEIVRIVQEDGIISAVQWYKDKQKCSLVDAKNHVDSVMQKHNVSPPSGGCMTTILLAIGLSLSMSFALTGLL